MIWIPDGFNHVLGFFPSTPPISIVAAFRGPVLYHAVPIYFELAVGLRRLLKGVCETSGLEEFFEIVAIDVAGTLRRERKLMAAAEFCNASLECAFDGVPCQIKRGIISSRCEKSASVGQTVLSQLLEVAPIHSYKFPSVSDTPSSGHQVNKVPAHAVLVRMVSQKGGVGKSAFAWLVVREYAAAGWSVRIVDRDISQGTSFNGQAGRLQNAIELAVAVEAYAAQHGVSMLELKDSGSFTKERQGILLLHKKKRGLRNQ